MVSLKLDRKGLEVKQGMEKAPEATQGPASPDTWGADWTSGLSDPLSL